MKRKIYHVVPALGVWWQVRHVRPNRLDSVHEKKPQAIARAKALASRRHMRAQVVIHGRNGKIQSEWTYRDDPRRSRG